MTTTYLIGLALLFLLGVRLGYVNRRLRRCLSRERRRRTEEQNEIRSLKSDMEVLHVTRACVRCGHNGPDQYFAVEKNGIDIRRLYFDSRDPEDVAYKRMCADELAEHLNAKV